MVPHLEKWDEMDKGHTLDEWLIGMIETGGKGRNTDIFRIDFATDSREGPSKFFKGVA
jgi:hypothetical protein